MAVDVGLAARLRGPSMLLAYVTSGGGGGDASAGAGAGATGGSVGVYLPRQHTVVIENGHVTVSRSALEAVEARRDRARSRVQARAESLCQALPPVSPGRSVGTRRSSKATAVSRSEPVRHALSKPPSAKALFAVSPREGGDGHDDDHTRGPDGAEEDKRGSLM